MGCSWSSRRHDTIAKAPDGKAAANNHHANNITNNNTTNNNHQHQHHGGKGALPHDPVHDLVFGYDRNFLDKYSLGRELGHGSFGTVRLAKHKATNEEYAVKCIAKSTLLEDGLPDELKREVAIMQRLKDCLNVVNIYGTFETATHVYMVLELCRGGELYQRMSKQESSEKDAARVIRSILRTVAQCHANGVLHRDLKPDNFLFVSKELDAPLKAIDFGLATFFTPGVMLEETSGTPYYMAPEVIQHNYSTPADLWSVGVIMYQLLSGRLPFTDDTGGRSIVAVFRKILKSNADLYSYPWDTVTHSAVDLLRRLLSKDPSKRPTALEALAHPWILEDGDASRAPLQGRTVQRLQQFSTYHQAKQTALKVVAQQMSQDSAGHLAELKDMFHDLDTDKSGSLDLNEFVSGLRRHGYKLTDEEVKQLMQQMDLDGNGQVFYDEFITCLLPWSKLQRTSQWHTWLEKTFAEIDVDGNGSIEADEIITLFKNRGLSDSMSAKAVQELVREADVDNDGKLSYEEFTKMICKDGVCTLPEHAYDKRR
eukprot:jgi/Chlat1/1042/Chrsp110S01554